jgi:hypothetical protein
VPSNAMVTIIVARRTRGSRRGRCPGTSRSEFSPPLVRPTAAEGITDDIHLFNEELRHGRTTTTITARTAPWPGEPHTNG